MSSLERSGIFESAYETRLITDRLRQTKAGDIVPWTEIEQLTGRPLPAIRGYINTARKSLLEDSIAFDVIRKQGLRRMTDVEIAQIGEAARRRTRQLVRRTLKTQAAIAEYNALPPDAKFAVMVTQTWGAAVLHAASDKAARAIETAVKRDNSQLVISRTLEALMTI